MILYISCLNISNYSREGSVKMNDVTFYQFLPEPNMEPDSEGNLSSVFMFFYNHKLKRIVFLTARTVR